VNGARWFQSRPRAIFQRVEAAKKSLAIGSGDCAIASITRSSDPAVVKFRNWKSKPFRRTIRSTSAGE
jgi:hypothetical protein